MATLGFEVHTDKENVTSASVTRKGLKGSSAQPFGFRDVNKLPNAPVRTALKNVNQQIPNPSSQGLSFTKNVATFKESFQVTSKPPLVVKPDGIENRLRADVSGKKTSSLKKSSQDSSTRKSSKSKSLKTKTRTELEPVPQIDIPNEDEYDSDSIFPKAERLSSYVDKLLTWRPPCLFGTVPDSDTDMSDHEEDLILNEEICQMPISLAEVPDFPSPEDLDVEPIDFPPLNFDEDDINEKTAQEFSTASPANLTLTDQSFNNSMPLGPLQMSESYHSFDLNKQNDSDSPDASTTGCGI